MGNQLVILDRDGVINRDSADFIKSPEELIPLKGSLEAIARLSQAGFEVVIITNQSGVGRGLFSADKLGQIHGRMIDLVRQQGGQIQTILYCPHHPKEGNGRKSVKIIEKQAELDLGDTAVFDNLASFVDALLAKEI